MRKNNYFGAGPSHLPNAILEQLSGAILDFNCLGLSIAELPHRGKIFEEMLIETQTILRELLLIPDDFSILFAGGGASFAFANIPSNLIGSRIGYIVTGRWSNLAYDEAQRISDKHLLLNDISSFNSIPQLDTNITDKVDFIYYTSNETVHGIQFKNFPNYNKPLISDMSSDICTRKIDWQLNKIVHASACKNLGIPGMHIIIISNDLLPKCKAQPHIFNFKTLVENGSLYNTPPTLQIYCTNLMVKWVKENGGIDFYSAKALQQAELIYPIIDKYPQLYISNLDKNCRSNINIVFKLPSSQLEELFLKEAEVNHLYGLKGHKVVGGIRISLYNSITLAQVHMVASFMEQFAQNYVKV